MILSKFWCGLPEVEYRIARYGLTSLCRLAADTVMNKSML